MCTELVFQIGGYGKTTGNVFGVVGAVFVGQILFYVGCSPIIFFPVFQANKAKPEAGVERRGEVLTTDFDQIDEKRSPVTNIIQQNASVSDSVIEL